MNEFEKWLSVAFAILVSFGAGMWVSSANQVCPACRPNRCEICSLSDTEPGPAETAQFCEDLIPDQTFCPVADCVEVVTECDCLPDYEAGVTDGISHGWKSCESVTTEKEPVRTKLEARNYRNSKK